MDVSAIEVFNHVLLLLLLLLLLLILIILLLLLLLQVRGLIKYRNSL